MNKKSKIFIWTFFILGGTAWAGILFNVLADNSTSKSLFIICFIVTAGVVKLFLSAKSEIQKKSDSEKPKPNYIGASIIVVFTFCYVYLSMMKGVPAALHALTSKEGSLVVTVDFKASRYSGSKCKGGIYLKGYNYFLNNKICGIGKETWDILRPGDSLILFGSKSLFGFRHTKYKKITMTGSRGASDTP